MATLRTDRLVDKDSGFIESNVVLDLSGKWRPKDPTFTLQKKKATPKKRRMGTNDAAPVPVSDPEPVQMPFLLDVVVLWRSIILWMAKLQPSAPYAVHTFAVMALLGGNDYVRMDDSHMGFPGIGFRTIWNTFHASINVRRCLCSCVRVLDKDESPPRTYLDEDMLFEGLKWIYHELLSVSILKMDQNKIWKKASDLIKRDRTNEVKRQTLQGKAYEQNLIRTGKGKRHGDRPKKPRASVPA